MDLQSLLFTFTGRINRAKYWIGVVIMLAAWFAVGLVITVLIYGMGGAGYMLAWVVGGAATLVALWAGLAIGFKRIHDRNRSAWWLALFWLVPGILQGIGEYLGEGGAGMLFALAGAAVALWGFVELGCLRGTEGPNQYGPDPLPAA